MVVLCVIIIIIIIKLFVGVGGKNHPFSVNHSKEIKNKTIIKEDAMGNKKKVCLGEEYSHIVREMPS